MPDPILVMDPSDAIRLARAHRDLHVSFDLFSTELQRLETSKVGALAPWHYCWDYPEDENLGEASPRSDETSPASAGEDRPCNALQLQIESYRSYMAKRTAERRFWESVASYEQDSDGDTVCAEIDYSLERDDYKKPGALERLRRACQVFKPR